MNYQNTETTMSISSSRDAQKETDNQNSEKNKATGTEYNNTGNRTVSTADGYYTSPAVHGAVPIILTHLLQKVIQDEYKEFYAEREPHYNE